MKIFVYNLYIYSFLDSNSIKITDGVSTAPTWINDTTLIFTMRSKPNKYGSRYYDLYKIENLTSTLSDLKFYFYIFLDIYGYNKKYTA